MANPEMAETDLNATIAEIDLFLRRRALAHAEPLFTPASAASAASAASSTPSCHWCYDTFASGSPIPLPCGHIFCHQCLNACFRTGLSNRRSFPPSCCAQPIDFAGISLHLDAPVKLRYAQKHAEYSIRDPSWCSQKVCSQLFTQGQIDAAKGEGAKFMVCEACRAETCFWCKQGKGMHGGGGRVRCPKQGGITRKDRRLAREERWKLCPNPQCSVVIVKSEACNHMICSECGTDFCYRCGTKIYDRRFHMPKCWRYRILDNIKYLLCFR